MSLAAEYGAAVICLLIDERGQARDVEWKMARRASHPRSRHDALRPRRERPHLRRADVPALDRRRRPAPRRDRHDRGDPSHQGRDPGGVHGARRVERVVRAQPRVASRAQLGVPARVRRGRARRGDRARRTHRAAVSICPRSSGRSASTSSTTVASRATTRCSDCSRSSPACRPRRRSRRTARAGRSTTG